MRRRVVTVEKLPSPSILSVFTDRQSVEVEQAIALGKELSALMDRLNVLIRLVEERALTAKVKPRKVTITHAGKPGRLAWTGERFTWNGLSLRTASRAVRLTAMDHLHRVIRIPKSDDSPPTLAAKEKPLHPAKRPMCKSCGAYKSWGTDARPLCPFCDGGAGD